MNTVSTPEAPSVMIIADDLTGATDSAVQFARAHWNTQLVLGAADELRLPPGSIAAQVTDARALDPAEARRRTYDAVSAGSAHASHLFLKIDSTLRGTVIEQIGGALDAWRTKHPTAIAVVCSAYPEMGRTIENGRLLVNGVPVNETPIGRDPVTPVTHSSVADLLPGTLAVTRSPSESLADALTAASASSSVVTVDASTTADIKELADAIIAIGSRAIPVGSAGLALALADAWGQNLTSDGAPTTTTSRVVVVASSIHDVTLSQIDALSAARSDVAVLRPTLEQLLVGERREQWHSSAAASDAQRAEVVVIAAPSERLADDSTSRLEASRIITESLAMVARSLVTTDPDVSLVLLGGEGARAVLTELGAERVRIHRAIREGIPLGTIEGGMAHGATVVTKAGGFGSRTDVSDIVSELLDTESKGTQQ